MQLYCAMEPVLADDILRVDLVPRPSSCKPRDRWLASEAAAVASACCSSSPASSKCCG
jgi:hypothetical protein